ncbi:MAG: class I SAM-dependent methyltransferase [Thermoplasmata archaeon]|nr:class I SAM-dependent methyltransferase [Thermoplasmata archaeon]
MDRRPLLEVLTEARTRGFLGPGPVEHECRHAEDLALAIEPFSGAFLDLGSGGGVPGLVLAQQWPEARGVLLDSHQRRCSFLRTALARLGLEDRIQVACGRAESLARTPALREQFDLVVARAFAGPAATAECGVAFLTPSGRLVVTEPPHDPKETEVDAVRWPPAGLTELGFSGAVRVRHGEAGAVVLERSGALDERWPRREGVPAKRPRWPSGG